MQIQDSVVLVTGANRGIGRAFARAALERGARKVYAAARDPATVDLPGVVPVRLDVTQPESITALLSQCADVTLLINNAGIAQPGSFLEPGSIESTRAQMETNFYGPLRMTQAFAPILAANGGGAVLNVLSVASWLSSPMLAAYSATKSAAWSLTNALRLELNGQGTQVVGLHVGFVDTDLTRDIPSPKSSPADVVAAAFDGLESGAEEVLADEITQQVKQSLSTAQPVYLAGVTR